MLKEPSQISVERRKMIQFKSDQVSDLWRNLIFDNPFFESRFGFTEDIKSNYVGVAMGYFDDLINVVFSDKSHDNFEGKFIYAIGFLQAVYVQQDIQELFLRIFRTKITKGELKKDHLYSQNRELRNELIGHPIRTQERGVVSTTLFSYQSSESDFDYLRYHRDNKFEAEVRGFNIDAVQQRHFEFLNKYFDKVLVKLNSATKAYLKRIDDLEEVIKKQDFATILNLTEINLKSFFSSDVGYDKATLSKIFELKDRHDRYGNFIVKVYEDLHGYINDLRQSIKEKFQPLTPPDSNTRDLVKIVPNENASSKIASFNYEIGKLSSRRSPFEFDLHGGTLRAKFSDSKIVQEELDHMANHLSNDAEYFSALKLIQTELNRQKANTR